MSVTEDRFTAAWWKTQYEGVVYRLNEQAAEMGRLRERADAMSRLYDELKESEQASDAVIGRLISENEELTRRLDELDELRRAYAANVAKRKPEGVGT